jgi:hypothetical protein
MRIFTIVLLLISVCLKLAAQTSSPSAGFFVQPGATLHIAEGGSLTLSNLKLVNNGLLNDNTGTLIISGNAASEEASIEGSGQTALHHLNLNKTSHDLFLKKNISIGGNLTLSAGNLKLASGNIDFGNSGKIVNETETSRIYGTGGILKATVILNAPLNANPANLGATITSTANLGLTEIKRAHSDFLINNPSISRSYEITPTNNSNLNASLKFQYHDGELNGNLEDKLRIWTSNNAGSSWSSVASGVNVNTNVIQASNLASFGLISAHVACPDPILTINSPLCERETLTLNITNADDETNYSWAGPNGFSSTIATITKTLITPQDAGIYTLTALKNGCTITSTANLTVFPLPAIPTITADNMEICKGGSVILTGSCSTADASFRWLTAPFLGQQTTALPSSNSRIINNPGTYTGLCESKEGCLSDEVSITITQGSNCNGQNFLTILPERPAVCPGQSITMTATGCLGSVSWSGGPTILTGASVSLTPDQTTSYVVNCSTGGSGSFQVVVAASNLNITSNVSTGKERYKAVNTLTSNKKVGSKSFTPGANVIYEAGNAIILEPGFTAEKWSVFKAEIKTCN